LEIADSEKPKEIIVESDTKVCIDVVSVNPDKAPWKIQTLVANISHLAVSFNYYCFC
jgi:hypothetical protein